VRENSTHNAWPTHTIRPARRNTKHLRHGTPCAYILAVLRILRTKRPALQKPMAKETKLLPSVRDALLRVRAQQSVSAGKPMKMDQAAVCAAVRYVLGELITEAITAHADTGSDEPLESYITGVLKDGWADLCEYGFIGNASQFRQACHALPATDELWQPKETAKPASAYE